MAPRTGKRSIQKTGLMYTGGKNYDILKEGAIKTKIIPLSDADAQRIQMLKADRAERGTG